MIRKISNCFCGVLDLLETGKGVDSHFSVDGNVITIIPLTKVAKRKVYELSYNDGSNEKEHWIYGYSEDNCAIAILQTTYLRTSFSTGIDLSAAKVVSPLIIKGSKSCIVDVKTFDTIEFYGGIVDKLHRPSFALEDDRNADNRTIRYSDPANYTSEYNIVLDGINIRVLYTIKVPIKNIDIDEVPDLKNNTHAALRFEFESPQTLDVIQKYYNYAMSLFQFCAGRLNVHAEVRLYKKQFFDPIFVKLIDGFGDYAEDVIKPNQVISLNSIHDKFINLFRLLNKEEEKPYLLFLPSRNGYANKILYTDVNDLCIAFEREYLHLTDETSTDKKEAAKKLARELIKDIDSFNDCPKDVKEKAKSILNAYLKNFSPSLKDKILFIYRRYKNELKSITEIKGHDYFKITRFYTDKEFEDMIAQFIQIRNRASHSGIQWNGGEQIFTHLKILVYYSILERAGFSIKESTSILSWMYGWQF